METSRFSGLAKKVIYVEFDRPRPAEVQLTLQADSRADLTLTPESLAFGRVKRGTSPRATVTVVLAGPGDYKILGAKSDSTYVRTRVTRLQRDAGESGYRVTARLRSQLPAGDWSSTVWLTTDNPDMRQLPIQVTAEVVSALRASPRVTAWQHVKVGTEAERKVLLRADQPFRILQVKGADAQVKVEDGTPRSAPLHVLRVKVRATRPGALARTIQVITDLKNDNQADFQVTAEVVP
jgi:hypothetical protein